MGHYNLALMKVALDRGTRTVQVPALSLRFHCFLQGIAERPLPCNYNFLEFVCAFHGANAGSSPARDDIVQRLAIESSRLGLPNISSVFH